MRREIAEKIMYRIERPLFIVVGAGSNVAEASHF